MKIVNLRTRDAGVTLRYSCDGYALVFERLQALEEKDGE